MTNFKGKIYQYSLSGEFLNGFENVMEAAFKLKIPNSTISSHLTSKSRHCHGYIFSKTYYLKYPIDKTAKKPNRKMIDYNKNIYTYDCNGNFLYKYRSLKEVSERSDVKSWIRACLKNENKTYDNKIWLYDYFDIIPDNILNQILNKRIVHIDENGCLVEIYKNASEASRKTGFCSSSISLVSTGKRNCLFGQIFLKYKDYKKYYGNV